MSQGTYDQSAIGRMIAWGGDHFVYEYGRGEVIKFSIINFLLGSHALNKDLHDYEVCKRYFGRYALETHFVAPQTGKGIAKIQPKVHGHFLTKKDMQNLGIRAQFEEIVRGYRRMADEVGVEVDLVGRHGFFTSSLSNIFVTEDGQLCLFDMTLLEIKQFHLLQPIFWALRHIVVSRQNSIIERFLEG